jgi:hypothetical protein
MLKRRRPQGSAKWAVRMLAVGALVAGVLVAGPLVALPSISSAAACGGPRQSIAAVPYACSISGQATVTGGTLSIQAPTTIKWASTLTGTDTIVQRQVTITAVDATGSGGGWTLTASATPFTDSTGTTKCTAAAPCNAGRGGIVLTSSSTGHQASVKGATPPVVACATSSTCTLPKNSVIYPVTIPTACGTNGTTCTPASVASAAATSGMGAITLATDWWLPIPANTFAGTYTSTITLSINSGP